ncbi:uncharacterized protein LOC117111228 [Anneissia japonica]|uniref:uncharacterized protein LOC117111228 n=1 Tax=Anneissia japonica TaxID=1529436 RepID=UPI001425B197|nr:uncharacterized protein LOC117111228 [Anneissia japonica]
MQGSVGRSSQLIAIVFLLVFFSFSSSSDCSRFRTDTTIKEYIYPMKELAVDVTSFEVSIKVMKYAYITLSPVAYDTDSQYELAIGNSEKANTAAIRRCPRCKDECSEETPYSLLEYNQFKTFWINFESGTIKIGRYNETAFMSWTDSNPLNIRYIGIATGTGLKGVFIFCDISFIHGQISSTEGLFGLFVFFLLPTLMLIRSCWKKIKRNRKHSEDLTSDEETEINDVFNTRGIENPAGPPPDPGPPSYEKCMEFMLYPVDEGASTSYDVENTNSDLPPSYETVMANYLFHMNYDDEPSDIYLAQCSISSTWDAGDVDSKTDDLETFV